MTTLLLFLDLEAETVVLNDGVPLTTDAAARAAVALLKGAAYHEPRYKPVIDTLEAILRTPQPPRPSPWAA